MDIGTKTEEALRGQPFIAKVTVYEQPKSKWERKCGLCFYRYGQSDRYKSNQNCKIVVDPTPHKLFGFKEGEYLPEQIDGKEVGHYCPHFLPFDAE